MNRSDLDTTGPSDADFSAEALRQLRASFEDAGAIEIVDALVLDLVRQRHQVQQGLQSGERKPLQLLTHTLKGNCRMLQAHALAKFCSELETMIEVGQLQEAKNGVPEMMRRYELLVASARQALPSRTIGGPQ